MRLVQPTGVEARDNWRIWVEYSDGVSGEVDLTDMAEDPALAELRNADFWKSVRITDYRAIAWSDDIELCTDSIYAELTGLTLDTLYLRSSSQRAHV